MPIIPFIKGYEKWYSISGIVSYLWVIKYYMEEGFDYCNTVYIHVYIHVYIQCIYMWYLYWIWGEYLFMRPINNCYLIGQVLDSGDHMIIGTVFPEFDGTEVMRDRKTAENCINSSSTSLNIMAININLKSQILFWNL